MLSCREATRLLSQAQDRPLSLSEQVQLYVHLGICAGCRNFGKHMIFIRKACQRFSTGATPDDNSRD